MTSVAEPRRDWSLLANIIIPLPSLCGAAMMYFYFNFIDPPYPGEVWRPGHDLAFFVLVVGTLVGGTMLLGVRRFGPLQEWLERLQAGADPSLVPPEIRRRALNAPLTSAIFTMISWTLAGLAYLPYQLLVGGGGLEDAWNVFSGIVLIGGPVASALSFLTAEFVWRRRIPLFYPRGGIERDGVFRVPVLVRLGATFAITSILPPLLMMMVSFNLVRRFAPELPEEMQPFFLDLLRAQVYIVAATGIASIAMAYLAARFINRPVQALRAAMAQVASGDLDARVPVRSTDELGELNERFNAMVRELAEAERARELFGRYVSPAVARQALDRGIGFGGEITRATAMFVDLRGFTALTERTTPGRVVELLNEYYGIVEEVCEREGGVITQFLGDGVVVVFGGPLRPLVDHARGAVRAARALAHALRARNQRHPGEPLIAGIGVCTGDMIAGNVGTGGRVTYTIVGDAVNQAARLQVKTRDLGASILLTESTRIVLGDGDGLVLRPMGAVPLRGIAAPVQVYALEV